MSNRVLHPPKSTLAHGARMIFFLAVSLLIVGCQTTSAGSDLLVHLQESATPDPPDRLSPESEQVEAKADMMSWLEGYLRERYAATVIGHRFVLTEPGFTDGARIRSKAKQYIEQELGGAPLPVVWYGEEYSFSHHDVERGYQVILWKLGEQSPRYVSMVAGTEFLPGTNERRLVGYFELKSSRE